MAFVILGLAAIIGIVNLVAVAVIAKLTVSGFASVWCAWAAVSSGAIALHLRLGKAHRRALAASG